jgi:hypothetical protein
MSSQVQNPKSNDDHNDEHRQKMSGWHNNLSAGAQKAGIYPSSSNVLNNSEGINDGNDANKANYLAMTKKRKAMHQANTSNRNSTDENINKYVKFRNDKELLSTMITNENIFFQLGTYVRI